MNIFSTNVMQSLEKAADFSSLKQKTISNNIANVDTPNYKAKEVTFRSALNEELGKFEANRTDPRHLSFAGSSEEPFITESANTSYSQNGNNVDIDSEMSEMAENQIYYNALIDRLNGQFQSLKTVIRGGK
ncbi:flagellar basal body rod protein FlgB [Metabacillus sp. GX 13764]|uniref:flagellar basal body rod protein FlgB n=1 Tax=Metabacillus kandeliae TaxID=2900151 RepID=UPI001E633AB9|nr:flagellar basal body rod protein FlgB [Metabacillus kandeliae]MCD7033787.1 flagellar basal body rod protein FlgB [Metabacillus kandeliae]